MKLPGVKKFSDLLECMNSYRVMIYFESMRTRYSVQRSTGIPIVKAPRFGSEFYNIISGDRLYNTEKTVVCHDGLPGTVPDSSAVRGFLSSRISKSNCMLLTLESISINLNFG